jgi:hypothetical protein
MAYLLDANVFIQAKNLHYGFDFCPAFWDWIDREHRADRVTSVAAVGDELIAGNDELADWADDRADLFLDLDQLTLPALARVAEWAQVQDFEPAAVNAFMQDADYYLIAYAMAHGYTVVTHEKPANSRKKIKIPTVCIALGISHMTPYAMLRRERARFVLS